MTTLRTLTAALMAAAMMIGPAQAVAPWADMPTKTFICDSMAHPEYAVVWVDPSKRTIIAQFVNKDGPVETYPLSNLSPFTTGNGRQNWVMVSSPYPNPDAILYFDQGNTYRAAEWVFSAHGHGSYTCQQFTDETVQPNSWVMH